MVFDEKELVFNFTYMADTILVVVAHSDDEVIGLGGTIANHICNNDKVYVVSMTDGVSARDVGNDKKR